MDSLTAPPSVQPQQTTAAAKAGASLASSDFETFLKMLTVQMQNQDPLNPIDSADYAVQLATFSGVEQAVRTNQLLEGLQAQLGLTGLAQFASWIGQEARSAAAVYVDGTPVTLSPEPASGADRVMLSVSDAQGRVVSREEMGKTAAPVAWVGTDATGAPLPRGIYTLSLESYAGETLLARTPVQHYAPITEARSGANGTMLVLRGGVEVQAAAISALRPPG